MGRGRNFTGGRSPLTPLEPPLEKCKTMWCKAKPLLNATVNRLQQAQVGYKKQFCRATLLQSAVYVVLIYNRSFNTGA